MGCSAQTAQEEHMSTTTYQARQYLGGEMLSFNEANFLWQRLTDEDEISLARQVLARLREDRDLVPASSSKELCRQEALLTSKDPELGAAFRHDRALALMSHEFCLADPALDGDAETLGIAAGIHKRRWQDLGRLEDLQAAAALYTRAAGPKLGEDAYPHINAAFLEDVLAHAGDAPVERRARARQLRQRIVDDLPHTGSWWNAASRAEALFGLQRYRGAGEALAHVQKRPAPWQLQTTARQLGHLAHLHEEQPLDHQEIREFFEKLLPGAADAARSAIVGRVGLALSGGGFRASFYHLGVLARLAELDVLRHIEVLSCVSGGSIVGACYWLVLRRRLKDGPPGLGRDDYVQLVRDLIEHFRLAVTLNLRREVQPTLPATIWRLLLKDQKGVLDPERTARALDERFYRPLGKWTDTIYMHDLVFTPADHSAELTGSEAFHPGKHNWLRSDKVPVLVLNATTVNTGHAWQFTPTWMGESPWAIHEAADSVPRLEWGYAPGAGWQMELGRAVAASACVPGIFAPLRIADAYDGIQVQLVDGGVHDNQGTVSLLALNCNVLLVSDACGQLKLQKAPAPGITGLVGHVKRSLDTLMERVRLASFADLNARRLSGLLRGFMFVHMKAGLDADMIRRVSSQSSYDLRRAPLSKYGVRKDFQQALAELRTDLDAFTSNEADALMACGYQMTSKAFQRDLSELRGLWREAPPTTWPFSEMLAEIRSLDEHTPRRENLLTELRGGASVKL